MTDREVIDAIIAKVGGLTKAAAVLGVTGPQVVNNWRGDRGIPAGARFVVRKVANQRAGLKLPMSWLDARKAAA